MIGEGAKQAEQKPVVRYSDIFDRMNYMGNLFKIAESVSNTDMPLLNTNPRMYLMGRDDMRIQGYSDVPVSDKHNLILAVGNTETGFYQVPIIQLAGGKAKEGIDVLVSGTINEEGLPQKFDQAKKLSDMANDLYGVQLNSAKRVYAVALMPKTDLLGQDVLVAGTIGGTDPAHSRSIYHILVNGFAMGRKIVGENGYFPFSNFGNSFAPVMYPQKDGKERFLKVGDMLNKKQLAKAESEGVFPGLTFIAGEFEKPFERDCLMLCERSIDSLESRESFGSRTKGAAGRVGLNVGNESNIRYHTINGKITGIDGILAMHLIGVGENAKPEQVRAEIAKLAG